MAGKTTTVSFPESTAQSRSQTITIQNLKRVLSVTVNTGNVSHTVNGNQVTINVSNGSYTRYTTSSYTPSKSVSDSRTSSTNSFPSSISYNDGTYSGSLSKSGSPSSTVVSGSAPASKTGTGTRTSSGYSSDGCSYAQSSARSGLPSSIPYSDGQGYTGTLSLTGSSVGSCHRSGSSSDDWEWSATATGSYSGTVTKPDTRVYSYTQSYSGTVYAATQTSYIYYYAYTVTVAYEDNYGQTLTLTAPVNGQVLSEGNGLGITGATIDPDPGDIVTVKYQINAGPIFSITEVSSDGTTPINFNKTLLFSGGVLKDGSNPVSSSLAEGVTHVLNVWSEDAKGGSSVIATRTFTVTLNRAPVLTENFPSSTDGLAGDSTISITGTVSDPDGQEVSMAYRLNGGTSISIPIQNGTWEILFTPNQLIDGENTIVLEAIDQLDAQKTRTFSIQRTASKTPLAVSHARYKLNPHTESAREIIAWMQYEKGDLTIDGALSIVPAGSAESYLEMQKTTSEISSRTAEDQFIGTYATPDTNITLKLTLTSTDINATEAATSLMGAIK